MKAIRKLENDQSGRVIRYAVVGLGYIAQMAVLPAFKNAKNSKLVAFVSDDPEKHQKLGKKYGVKFHYSYDQYDACLKSGEIDAVYIALPNSQHCEFTLRAARAGIHVLCEKPMAVTPYECELMIQVCKENRVKLMIAYRLHFEKTNLKAIEIVKSGKIGAARIFNSLFSMQTKAGNIRLKKELGGGPLYDIGIYCLNAARYIFGENPYEVFAYSASRPDPRFEEVDEMISSVLRFSDERLATFTCSFGAADSSQYEILGTKGSLRLDPAYEYAEELQYQLTIEGKKTAHKSAKRDQFGPELFYFSNCVIQDKEPEPSGQEGLTDIRIIQALYESARSGKPVQIEPMVQDMKPSLKQEITLPAVEKPQPVHIDTPHY